VPAALQTDKVAVPGVYLTKADYNTDGWPKQKLFHLSDKKYRLQVGGYGSGKSRPLLWEGVFHCLEYPGSNSLILRKTIPDLKRTVVDKFLSDVPKKLYQFYNQTDHIVYFHPDPVTKKQSKLYLAACERDDDVGKFLSTEYVYIGFEELGEFSFAVWDALTGRNRCPIPGSRSCMAGATNPTGVGWGWIKKLWVEKKPFSGMVAELYNPDDYEYIHSTVDDNPIYSKDAEYLKTLEMSPLAAIRRWGKMDGVSGNYFDNWDETRHRRAKAKFTFEKWQPIWIGWDYGFGHYACVVFFTKAITKNVLGLPKMVNVVIGELVLQEKTPREQAEAILLSIPQEDRPKVESVHFSWERFNRTVSNFTVADEVGEILSAGGLPRPTRSNNDRVAGWMKCYSLLDTDEMYLLEDSSTLQPPATAPTVLAESIPLLERNKKKLEDVLKPPGISLADDIGDAWRMGVAGTLLDEEDKPADVKLREKLASIPDPLARHMEAMKNYFAEKRKAEQSGMKYIPTWQKGLK
jgi:phage terminase large subunit